MQERGLGHRLRHRGPLQLCGLMREPRGAGKEGRPLGPQAWEPSFHGSAAELWFPLPCPLWKGHDHSAHPLPQATGWGLCSGESWQGPQEDPGCLSGVTVPQGPLLGPRPRPSSPAHLGSSAHCH